MKILLKSDVYVVMDIFGNTKAQFFQDIKIGDELQFSLPMKNTGRSSRGLYAVYVTINNLTQNTSTKRSLAELENRLSNFDLVNKKEI